MHGEQSQRLSLPDPGLAPTSLMTSPAQECGLRSLGDDRPDKGGINIRGHRADRRTVNYKHGGRTLVFICLHIAQGQKQTH